MSADAALVSLTGFFYELQNNYVQAERCFREAKKVLRAQLAEERRILEAAEEERKKLSSSSIVLGNRQTQEVP